LYPRGDLKAPYFVVFQILQ
jgi:hypothetical protein